MPESDYQIIKVPKDCIPEGGILIEAYDHNGEIIVCGDPESEPEDFDTWSKEKQDEWYENGHNCDLMGCGTLSHVLYRFPKKQENRDFALDIEAVDVLYKSGYLDKK